MFKTFVFYSQIFLSQILLTIFLRLLYTTLVPNSCLQLLLKTFACNFCSQLTTFVQNFCSQLLFKIPVKIQDHKTKFVKNFCSYVRISGPQNLLKTSVYNYCSQILPTTCRWERFSPFFLANLIRSWVCSRKKWTIRHFGSTFLEPQLPPQLGAFKT